MLSNLNYPCIVGQVKPNLEYPQKSKQKIPAIA